MLRKQFTCQQICKQFDTISFNKWFSFASDQYTMKPKVLDKVTLKNLSIGQIGIGSNQ